ncbi:MAG: gliding motility-associated C-terminal domain-containing protein [Bacteroidetes bacterium]|nr:gliding motility-associated C-terminal domain-containing protein [Bacteroidota bacterium]
MNKVVTGKLLLCILFSLFIVCRATAQLTVNPGVDKSICKGGSAILGGSPTATGGVAPYTYSWVPATSLTSSTSSNPTSSPAADITYTLTVKDAAGTSCTGIVSVFMNYLYYVNAGLDSSICDGESMAIGGVDNTTGVGITYSWKPSTGLDDITSPRPIASPVTTTAYTLTATTPGCAPKISMVTITVIHPPIIDAGPDVTIKAGERTTLHASGGAAYAWSPQGTLTYYFSPNPDAEPLVTTTYYLYATESTNTCPSYDSVTVFVEPSTDIVIYNTFTPNGDGNNDTWYIGNILSYPNNKLEIFNRYGKLVYKIRGYANTWDGKSFGEDLPAATYFFNIDLGDGGGKFHGTVTIIK